MENLNLDIHNLILIFLSFCSHRKPQKFNWRRNFSSDENTTINYNFFHSLIVHSRHYYFSHTPSLDIYLRCSCVHEEQKLLTWTTPALSEEEEEGRHTTQAMTRIFCFYFSARKRNCCELLGGMIINSKRYRWLIFSPTHKTPSISFPSSSSATMNNFLQFSFYYLLNNVLIRSEKSHH